MKPTWRISLSRVLFVSLFLRNESLLSSAEVKKDRLGLSSICNGNSAGCLKRCSSGWMFYKDHCYGLIDEPVTWSEAEVACQAKKKQAHLASILTQEELKEVTKYISSVYGKDCPVWVGLHDPRKTGHWQWTDESLVSFLPWDIGEPNNIGGAEHCTLLAAKTGFHKLNDAPCALEMAYICKYPL